MAALLAELPERKDKNVMVPLGSAAFLPGQLVNTSQCLVRVGEPPLSKCCVPPGPTCKHVLGAWYGLTSPPVRQLVCYSSGQ